MSHDPPAIPRELVVLRQLAGLVSAVIGRNLDGVTHEESLVQPRPAGNCLNWVLGHLLQAYNSALPLLGQEPVMEEDELARYARGSEPLTDGGDALPLEVLRERWKEAVTRVDRGLAALDAEALDGPAPSIPGLGGDGTLRSLLTFILMHQVYHAGQTGVLRRIAGHDRAIP